MWLVKPDDPRGVTNVFDLDNSDLYDFIEFFWIKYPLTKEEIVNIVDRRSAWVQIDEEYLQKVLKRTEEFAEKYEDQLEEYNKKIKKYLIKKWVRVGERKRSIF